MRELPRRLRDSMAEGGPDLTVAVVRLGAMGDVLRTLPAVRILRRALPCCRLEWITDQRWVTVLDGHRDLDEIVPVPFAQWSRMARSPLGWPRLCASLMAFRRMLRERQIRLLLDFHGGLKSGLVGRMSGAPVRLGYFGHQQREGNHWLTTHHVASGDRRTPRMERNLDLVRGLGIEVGALPPAEPPLLERGRAAAGEVLSQLGLSDGEFAIVAPGASLAQAYKTPPPAILATAAATLAAHDLTPLVVYGPGELELAEKVVTASRGVARLAPPTDLATLTGLLARATMFVGGDSGPLHMACSVGCPVVGLYGPTDPQVNQPWGVPYRTVAPEGRSYTGIKRVDRTRGFEGMSAARLQHEVEALLDETARGERVQRLQPRR